MSGVELITVLPGIITMFMNGYRLYLRYKEKQGKKADPDSSFGTSLVAGRKDLQKLYNQLATRLGQRFSKGDAQVYNDLKVINRRIEVIIVQLEQRLDSQELSSEKRLASDENQWDEDRGKEVQEQIKQCEAKIDAFVSRTWHTQSITLLTYHPRLSVLPPLPDCNIYCDGALRLQHNPKANFMDISVNYSPPSGGTCMDCYLEIRDIELPEKAWTPTDWTKVARCHIKASMSRMDRRALVKCVICAQSENELLILSVRAFLRHLERHEGKGRLSQEEVDF